MAIMIVTSDNFTQVIAENELVLIDFWAEWCQPCKSFSKVVETVAEKYPEVLFGTVDIDKEKELARDFNIISVPSIMILKNQVVVYADSGALPPSALIELIEQAKKLVTVQS